MLGLELPDNHAHKNEPLDGSIGTEEESSDVLFLNTLSDIAGLFPGVAPLFTNVLSLILI